MDVSAATRARLGPRRVASAKRLVAPVLLGDLTRLGRWFGTDKAGPKHPYTQHYERHLRHLRRRPVRLLEIGIGGYGGGLHAGGGSLRMWRSWMPKAQIVGVDLAPRDFRERRIRTFTGDQTDRVFLEQLIRDQGPFDVMIDDGSHVNEHVRATFRILWPLLPPGGIYVIEDLATAYDPVFGGGPPGTPGTSVELLKELVDRMYEDGDVAALAVYDQIAFVTKR